MTTTDTYVDDYLSAVERALVGVPASQRTELLADLRAHIEEELGDEPSEARAREIVERLGDPETIAAAARGDADRPGSAPPVKRAKTGWIIAAVAVAGFAFLLCAGFWLFFAESSASSEPPVPGPAVTVPIEPEPEPSAD